jgi:hypothetical protein
MDHKLRVVVRLDIDRESADVRVGGCLTNDSCRALLPLICRISTLNSGMTVTIDLSGAEHVERGGLEMLERLAAGIPDGPTRQESTFSGRLVIAPPEDLPQCPASLSRQRHGRVVVAA